MTGRWVLDEKEAVLVYFPQLDSIDKILGMHDEVKIWGMGAM